MRRRNNFLLWGFFSGVVLLDQVSKYFAEINLNHRSIVLNAWLNLTLFHNTGCAWGFFRNRTVCLGLLGIVALFFVYRWRSALEVRERPVAFGLLLGGVVGNIIDRLIRGFVVDFIVVDLQIYRWPTFNVADAALCVAVFILIFFSPKNKRKEKLEWQGT
jgi:signal peptidase II